MAESPAQPNPGDTSVTDSIVLEEVRILPKLFLDFYLDLTTTTIAIGN